MEEGLTEAEAIAGIGSVDKIVTQIVAETPITKLVREKVKPKRSLQAWEIILLVLGSPLWISLLIASFAVILSLYIVIWAVIVSLWAVDFACVVCAFGGLVAGNLLIWQHEVMQGGLLICGGFVLAGLSILLFFGCKALTKGAAPHPKGCSVSKPAPDISMLKISLPERSTFRFRPEWLM